MAPMTPYAFVYEPGPRRNSLQWPDFWYMQGERLGMLARLRNGTLTKGFDGFRPSALYTSTEQVKMHVEMLHQGKRNRYLLRR